MIIFFKFYIKKKKKLYESIINLNESFYIFKVFICNDGMTLGTKLEYN